MKRHEEDYCYFWQLLWKVYKLRGLDWLQWFLNEMEGINGCFSETTPPSIAALKQTQTQSLHLRSIHSTKRVVNGQNDVYCFYFKAVAMKINVFRYMLCMECITAFQKIIFALEKNRFLSRTSSTYPIGGVEQSCQTHGPREACGPQTFRFIWKYTKNCYIKWYIFNRHFLWAWKTRNVFPLLKYRYCNNFDCI